MTARVVADPPRTGDDDELRAADAAQRFARLRRGLSLLLHAVLAFVAMGAVAIVAARLLGVHGDAAGNVPPGQVENALLAQGVGNLALVAVAAFAPAALALGRRRWMALAAPAYVCFLVAWVPISSAYSLLMHQVRIEIPKQPHMEYFYGLHLDTPGSVAALLVVVVVGPVTEEVLFRGLLLGGLQLLLGPLAALFITAALFGVLHGALLAFPIGLLGLLFGWLRQRSGGLAAPVVAHMLHNGIMVVLAMHAPELMRMLDR